MSRYYLYQYKDSPEYFYIQKGINISLVYTKKGKVKSVIGTITKLNLVKLSLLGSIEESQLNMYLSVNPEMTIGDLITILEA